LAAALGGVVVFVARRAPVEAVATGRPPLDTAELRSLEAWYEALVPGATRSRAGDFVQAQLGVDPRLSLLYLRYLNWPTPYVEFYRQGLAALDGVSRRRRHAAFAALPRSAMAAIAAAAAADKLGDWPASPPLKAWYTATRADATDVVYGTASALARQDMGMTQNPPPRW
jgi:hypothetical protein